MEDFSDVTKPAIYCLFTVISHIPAVIIVEIKFNGVARIEIRLLPELSCIGGDLAHNQADNLTGYLLYFGIGRRISSKLFYRVSIFQMWIMNDLWPTETLCIIIMVDYAKSKINDNDTCYSFKRMHVCT